MTTPARAASAGQSTSHSAAPSAATASAGSTSDLAASLADRVPPGVHDRLRRRAPPRRALAERPAPVAEPGLARARAPAGVRGAPDSAGGSGSRSTGPPRSGASRAAHTRRSPPAARRGGDAPPPASIAARPRGPASRSSRCTTVSIWSSRVWRRDHLCVELARPSHRGRQRRASRHAASRAARAGWRAPAHDAECRAPRPRAPRAPPRARAAAPVPWSKVATAAISPLPRRWPSRRAAPSNRDRPRPRVASGRRGSARSPRAPPWLARDARLRPPPRSPDARLLFAESR